MHRRGLHQSYPQEAPQGQTVRTPPGDAPLAIQSFEVANQKHPEVDSRWDAGPTAFLVVGCAELFDEVVETSLSQNGIELGVERMTRTGSHLRRSYEHLRLFGCAFSECHKFKDPIPEPATVFNLSS